MDISQSLDLQNWLFFAETTLLLSVRRWMCIRGELLLCREYSFLPQKTADNLNYSQRQRDAQKTNNAYLHLLQLHMDPRSTLCNWLFNRQFKNENSHSLKQPDKCVQLETAVPLSPKNKNKKSWVKHVKTIAGNPIPCRTVRLTIQNQHFAENYGTKP